MRISTLTIFNQNVSSMNRQQAEFMKVGQQIASGKRIVNISDDPQAMTRAINVSQSKAVAEQYNDARIGVKNSLAQEESVLNSVNDLYTRAKTLMVQASSDTLSDSDRASVASELRGLYEALTGLANSRDGAGRFLFGGYQDDTAPFVRDATTGNVSFVGSTDVREQRVDGERLMKVGHTGDAIFGSVHSSAGYTAEAGAANTGELRFGEINITDPNDPQYGDPFTIEFGDNAGVTQYRVNGGAWQNYTDPQAIAMGGVSIQVQGQPQPGDTLDVARGKDLNTNIFAGFEQALEVLENPAATAADKAKRANVNKTFMNLLDNSMNNVLTTRAEVGARLNEIDALDTIGGNRMLAYEQTMSDLTDLDYVEAASKYSLQMVGLQASQKAFVDIKGMSLFNYLK